MKYLNTKTCYGIETVDCLDRNEFKTYKEYRTELKRLVSEYSLAGIPVYISSRSTKEWKIDSNEVQS